MDFATPPSHFTGCPVLPPKSPRREPRLRQPNRVDVENAFRVCVLKKGFEAQHVIGGFPLGCLLQKGNSLQTQRADPHNSGTSAYSVSSLNGHQKGCLTFHLDGKRSVRLYFHPQKGTQTSHNRRLSFANPRPLHSKGSCWCSAENWMSRIVPRCSLGLFFF